MKFISFKKYTEYLESLGYTKETGENLYYDLGIRTVFFTKPGISFDARASIWL